MPYLVISKLLCLAVEDTLDAVDVLAASLLLFLD